VISFFPEKYLRKKFTKSSRFFRATCELKTALNYQKNLQLANKVKVAVHLHLYYLDLADEFIADLKNIPVEFDLFLTTVGHSQNEFQKFFDAFPNVKFLSLPNVGRDVGGLFAVMHKFGLSTYDVVIKIHGKKSLHTGAEQFGWRQRLVKTLIGSKKQAAFLIALFANKKVGMVGSYDDLSSAKYDDEMKDYFAMCKKLHSDAQKMIFFRGTMFAIRGSILDEFIAAGMIKDVYDANEYAVEAVFGNLVIKRNQQILALESFCNSQRQRRFEKFKKRLKIF
jgi:hypothetical protein